VAETRGHRQLTQLETARKEGLGREFRERFGLTIEQRTAKADPALVMADGTRLEPLSRARRRQLEKDGYAIPDKSGAREYSASSVSAL
jgi:hypothetical protein